MYLFISIYIYIYLYIYIYIYQGCLGFGYSGLRFIPMSRHSGPGHSGFGFIPVYSVSGRRFGLPFRLPRFGFRINTWRFKSFGARPNRFRGGLNLPQQDQRCTPPQVASIFQVEGVIGFQFIPVHSGSFRLFRFIPFRFMPLHPACCPFRFVSFRFYVWVYIKVSFRSGLMLP